MISMKLALDKRRQRNDGSYSIIIRISYKGESRSISTGFTCKPEQWDSRYNCLKVTKESEQVLSGRLQEQRMKYQERLLEFERKLLDSATTVQIIKEYLTGKATHCTTVLDFWNLEIDQLEQSKRFGNARNYKSALKGISKEMTLNKPFSHIDYSWLAKLDLKLRSKGVKPNSVAVYMRTLRALYNKAINVGIADQQDYPFRRYKIKSESTAPRVASIEELKKFFAHSLAPENPMFDHWNYGRLIFLLRGINFADLAILTRDNIKHGRIVYKRSKTHKLYSVQLLPLAEKILYSYIDDDRITLLPILTNEEYNNKKCLPDRLGQLRKTTNKWLKRIGQELSIEERLSTYVFRYSHANACKKLGYSKDLISESLGHAYGLAVSSAYLENFNVELIDEMNQKVCDEVIGLS